MEAKIAELEPDIRKIFGNRLPARWVALRLLDGDTSLVEALKERIGKEGAENDGTVNRSPYPVEA